MRPSIIADHVKPDVFLAQAVEVKNMQAMASLLSQLPIVDENVYLHDPYNPTNGWVEGSFHWMPLGRDRGNSGRIKLASRPEGPIAERAINGMEALIELHRRQELLNDKNALAPESPRDAVARYFSLPPLDQIPMLQTEIKGLKPKKYTSELAKHLRIGHSLVSHCQEQRTL